jgi:orotate phosphoribosyltransferase-like protein
MMVRKKFRITSRKHREEEEKKKNFSNVAEIINHTQVTIINDIQHYGSNVEERHRIKKNGSEENLCLI